jgi:general stress protein CsbA
MTRHQGHHRPIFFLKISSVIAALPEWVYLSALVIVNTWLSIPLLKSPMIAETDAYARAFQAWQPLVTGNLQYIEFLNGWLPFHILLLRGVFYFTHDLWTSGRLLTFAISSIGIPLFYAYTHNYFSRNIARISTLMYTIFPLRLILGTQTLSEGVFFPLFLLVLFVLTRPHITHKTLTIAVIGGAVASGIRYDMWFLLPYIWLHALWRFNSWKTKTLTIIASLIVPLWWTINTNIQSRNLFSYATQKIETARIGIHPEYFNIYLALHNVTDILLNILPMPFLVLSGIGLFTMLHDKKTYPSKKNLKLVLLRFLGLLLPLFYIFFIFIQVFAGTMEWVPQRYLFISTSLLLPFIIYGAFSLLNFRRNIGIMLILLSLCILPSYIKHEYTELTTNSFPQDYNMSLTPDFWQLITYLKQYPNRQYQYVSLPQSDELFIPVGYFSSHLEILTHMMGDHEVATDNVGPHIVTEKPLSHLLTTGYRVVYEDDHCSVLEKITE